MRLLDPVKISLIVCIVVLLILAVISFYRLCKLKKTKDKEIRMIKYKNRIELRNTIEDYRDKLDDLEYLNEKILDLCKSIARRNDLLEDIYRFGEDNGINKIIGENNDNRKKIKELEKQINKDEELILNLRKEVGNLSIKLYEQEQEFKELQTKEQIIPSNTNELTEEADQASKSIDKALVNINGIFEKQSERLSNLQFSDLSIEETRRGN